MKTSALANYGALGLPLAFVALPLYVTLPQFYASLGLPLALVGAVLLGVRLLDALSDPLIGRLCDRLLARSALAAWRFLLLAAVLLMSGFALLFQPQVEGVRALAWWCAVTLLLTTLAYSLMSVMHQAWGARLGAGDALQTRLVAWREGLALVGVLTASVLPTLVGLGTTTAVFAVLLTVGALLLIRGPKPLPGVAIFGAVARTSLPRHLTSLRLPWSTPGFRSLIAVFLLNGVASAVPATLVLFFIRDRLQLPELEALFLGSYFGAAALALPLWLRVLDRIGLERGWLAGMLLAVLTFAFALTLDAGDRNGFWLVCLASGVALGADLAAPGALLTRVITRAGHAQLAEGAYFGWWNFASKLTLALAAGLALPLLQLLGYSPGQTDPASLRALSLTYCLLPCALKLAAAALLYTFLIRPESLPCPAPLPHPNPAP
jgi:glycoside/pentoside/hexuronide:cation symporter, GPH family